MYRTSPLPDVHASPGPGGPVAGGLAALAGGLGRTATTSDLQQISPLVWIMVAISAGGAIITYAFLVYAVWRYRDPSTRRRNYG
jgi:heme/copper-type cytochrome/quinol oxidase subunit 2